MRIFGIAYFLCFITVSASFAQYQNVWCFGGQYSSTQTGSGLSFSEFPPRLFTTAVQSNLTSNSVSDSTGSLLFYNDGFRVFNKFHQVMENGDSINVSISDGYNAAKSNIVIQTRSQNYILLNCNNDLTYSVIDFNTNALGKVSKKNVLLKKLISNQHSTICIDAYPVKGEQNSYWLVADTRDTAFVYKLTTNGILYYNHFLHVNKAYGTIANTKFSHDGKLLVKTVFIDTALGATVFFNDFDPVSGIMSNERSLKLASLAPVYPYDSIYYVGPSHCEFSPSDSIIYFTHTGGRIFPANLFRITQLNRYDFSQTHHFTITGPGGMIKLAPDGRIYALNNHINIQNYFIIIPKPNLWGNACKIYQSNLKATIKNMGTSHQRGLPGGYTAYKRLEFNAYNTCHKTQGMTFQNLSDTTFYKTFNWYWGDGDSLVNQPFSAIVSHTYTQSGKYFVKLRASTQHGYTIWFTDTITFVKPPIADFTFKTDTGCQWVQFQFTNLSHADTMAAQGMKWLWYFGDGQTDTIEHAAHAYKKSGNFSVKLVADNGFCADSISKSNSVYILPAPKPGFTATPLYGCAPLNVQITDTVSFGVSKKEYFFEDSLTWTNQFLSQFSRTFIKPGSWKIIQKLTGVTGCITKDSLFVKVKHGFADTSSTDDFIHCTYSKKNEIKLFWNKENGAKTYQILHSNLMNQYKLLSTTNDTFYVDALTENKIERENFYRILAIDSCDNKVELGNHCKPVLLQGTSNQNEYAELNFSNYEGWASGVKEYRIETLEKNGYFNYQKTINSIGLYIDSTFWRVDCNEQCYRITAIQTKDTNIVSYSNIICLDYLPEIHIPDAFSPNGDNLNDEFAINSIGITDFEITIFNIWGQKIFQTTDKTFRWSGNNVPTGTYIYILYARNTQQKSISKRGTITLIR